MVKSEKEEIARKLNELLGIEVNWSRMSLKDLKKIYEVVSTPSLLMDVMARSTQQRIRNMRIGEVVDVMASRRRPLLERMIKTLAKLEKKE